MTWAMANRPLTMLKSMPMVRAAVRFTSATVTMSITCCSPGTRRRLTIFGFPSRISRMALTAACSSPRPGMKATLTFLDVDLRSPCRRRVLRDDAENLCRLDNILRLAAHDNLIAHQRELDGAVRERFLDFALQHLERLREGFHLGL